MIRSVVICLLTVLFVVITVQGAPLYSLWSNSSEISQGQSRGEVISTLGAPIQEWAKASNLDIWGGKLLLGGVRVDISYSGDDCDWENRDISPEYCKVSSVHKIYYTLWGNTWFLAYAPKYT
ncbi:MAG: hypothetical protein ABJJ44_15325 [Paraglaciecola sp.]|uniref:hypothetical protein n=1 Tax=Paraglaciecola sp. TaxID=1920173 RepID=UPI003297F5CB